MTDRLWYEINIPYFSYEKAGIIMIVQGGEDLNFVTTGLKILEGVTTN